MLQLPFGRLQIVLCVGNVSAHLHHLALHAAHFIGHGAKLLLVGFFIGLQARFRLMFLGLQLAGFFAQFFVVHSRVVGQDVVLGFHLGVGIRPLFRVFLFCRGVCE